jgi:hypothetical protein
VVTRTPSRFQENASHDFTFRYNYTILANQRKSELNAEFQLKIEVLCSDFSEAFP